MIDRLIYDNCHQPCHDKHKQVNAEDRITGHVLFRVKCNPTC